MKQFFPWLSRAILVASVLACFGNILPSGALAAEMCTCFCGSYDLGAYDARTYKSANECAQACADGNETYVGCFVKEEQFPENNNLCWTEEQCTSYEIDVANEPFPGTWGGQSPYCTKESVTNAEKGYCYGPLIPVVLNVPILGVTKIDALGDYVNLLYKYALPLASLFGVLMFTIAGFQYMTAGGSKGAVTKAKTRMTNTVIGLVLLFSVYALAYLIDPRLVRFNELRPPLVKQAILIDEDTTCEALAGYGFLISPTSGECGEKGTVNGVDDADDTIANAPEIGDTCLFSGCQDKSKSCVIKGDNSGGTCVACADISTAREELPGQALGISPSQTVCAQIAAQAQSKETNANHIYSCYYDNDFSVSGDDLLGVDECVQFYTSGQDYVDCTYLQDLAPSEEDGCLVYGRMDLDSYGVNAIDLSAYILQTGDADEDEDFESSFGDICRADICNVADLGRVKQGSCDLNDPSIVMSYVQLIPILGLPKYSCVGSVHASE